MKMSVPISPVSDIFEMITVDDELVEQLHNPGTDPAIKVLIRNHLYSLASQKYIKKLQKKLNKYLIKYTAKAEES